MQYIVFLRMFTKTVYSMGMQQRLGGSRRA